MPQQISAYAQEQAKMKQVAFLLLVLVAPGGGAECDLVFVNGILDSTTC